jgi:hypothetical protein
MMSDEQKENTVKKKGGQAGNQNARKHGFYSTVLDEKEMAEYQKAVEVEGLDEEIAMMRVKLYSLLEKDPENVRLITQAVNALVRMMVMKQRMDKGDENDLIEVVKNVITNLILPLGVSFGPKMFD